MAPRTRVAAAETTQRTTAPEAATSNTAAIEAIITIAAAPEATTSKAAAPDAGEEDAPEEGYELALALPPLLGNPSAAFIGLARLPTLRRPELRPARGVPNLTRMGNREAVLAQSVGAPAPSPCGLCAKNGGPWTSCIVAAGFLRGSCANCHYGGSGVKCTLRQTGK
jgi:hypothetical protein